MVNRQLFDNRLTQLAGYIVDLIESQNMEQQEYLEDKKTQRYIERTLHLAIECCLDIGNHLIADQNWREPLNNKDVFTVLEENGVVSSVLLPNLSKMAQFRNILVHDYAKIEPDIIHGILKNNVADFQKFIKEINEALKGL
jgi:uncharacterized protein YutE (UPF0331/DUF86 family)